MVDFPDNLNLLVDHNLSPKTIQCSVDMYRRLKTQMERLGFSVELNRRLRTDILMVSEDVFAEVDPLHASDSGV